jgi:hypothetical protein
MAHAPANAHAHAHAHAHATSRAHDRMAAASQNRSAGMDDARPDELPDSSKASVAHR